MIAFNFSADDCTLKQLTSSKIFYQECVNEVEYSVIYQNRKTAYFVLKLPWDISTVVLMIFLVFERKHF